MRRWTLLLPVGSTVTTTSGRVPLATSNAATPPRGPTLPERSARLSSPGPPIHRSASTANANRAILYWLIFDEMRRTLGTAVFAGMLGVTFFGLFLTPLFYVLLRAAVLRKLRPARAALANAEGTSHA